MPMLCPKCRSTTLEPCTLDDALNVVRCSHCRGVFIASERYFGYLASDAHVQVPPAGGEAPADSPQLKFCPACGKFMHYYPIGHGVAFGIDKCNTCGGVWLNDGEWDDLRRHDLHRKLHVISSDAWQDRVQKQQRAASDRAALLRRLGAEDLARLESVSAWVQNHPHASEIMAFLRRAVPGTRE